MLPPHMRSAYPAEMNDERLRSSRLAVETKPETKHMNDSIDQLLQSADHSPPGNKRKRRSGLCKSDEETTIEQSSKRRSLDDAIVSNVTGYSTSRITSNSPERRKHRDASQTTYQRPGPPTPAKNLLKESNVILSVIVCSFTNRVTRHI